MHGFGNEHFYGMERGYHLGLETSHILYFRGIGVIVVFLPRFNKWAGWNKGTFWKFGRETRHRGDGGEHLDGWILLPITLLTTAD